MDSRDSQVAQLEAAIAALETQRGRLGEAVVEVTLDALRHQLADVQTRRDALSPRDTSTSHGVSLATDEALARIQDYPPKGFAEDANVGRRGRMEGERKQVTVLFADLSGFTAVSERMDPEVIRAFQNDLFEEMAAVVYQHKGFVEKFVGDAVMAVFGAPVTHEDDA